MKKTLIGRIDVGATPVTKMEFSSITGDYDGLYLLLSMRSNTTGRTDGWEDTYLTINGTHVPNVLQVYSYNSATVGQNASGTSPGGFSNHSAMTANAFSNVGIFIGSYWTNDVKPFIVDSVTEQNTTSNILVMAQGQITLASPLHTLSVEPYGADFVQYSSASLYGVTMGSDGTTTVS